MKKNPHVIWVCSNNELFFRAKGAVRCRANSVLPKLTEHGMRLNVLIPYNSSLLPKTKLSTGRVIRASIQLAEKVPVELIKLTKGESNPGVFMLKTPPLDAAVESAVFSKAAIALAEHLRKPVDIFHVFNWNASLVPLYIELEKSGSPIFKNARTFLNVSQIGHEGDFSPALLPRIGIPETLFHPEGIEFFGKISFLKTGMLFADGIGLIDGRHVNGSMHNKSRMLYEGIFEMQMHKLRRWASDHSLRAHLDAYQELLQLPKQKPLLDSLLKRLHKDTDAANAFIDSWGPVPRDRYGVNQIGFLIQAPKKAFAFWEWNGADIVDFGIVIDRLSVGQQELLSRGLGSSGEFWFNVEPDQEYHAELVGWTSSGQMKTLLRSQKVRTPRDRPSSNTTATLIDVNTKQLFKMEGSPLGAHGSFSIGASEHLGASGRFGSSNTVEWGKQ